MIRHREDGSIEINPDAAVQSQRIRNNVITNGHANAQRIRYALEIGNEVGQDNELQASHFTVVCLVPKAPFLQRIWF